MVLLRLQQQSVSFTPSDLNFSNLLYGPIVLVALLLLVYLTGVVSGRLRKCYAAPAADRTQRPPKSKRKKGTYQLTLHAPNTDELGNVLDDDFSTLNLSVPSVPVSEAAGSFAHGVEDSTSCCATSSRRPPLSPPSSLTAL